MTESNEKHIFFEARHLWYYSVKLVFQFIDNNSEGQINREGVVKVWSSTRNLCFFATSSKFLAVLCLIYIFYIFTCILIDDWCIACGQDEAVLLSRLQIEFSATLSSYCTDCTTAATHRAIEQTYFSGIYFWYILYTCILTPDWCMWPR